MTHSHKLQLSLLVLFLAAAPIARAQAAPTAVLQTPVSVDVRRVAFSADGRLLATIRRFGTDITVWDRKTGRKILGLPLVRVSFEASNGSKWEAVGPGSNGSLLFNSDGRYLAVLDSANDQSHPPIVLDTGTGEVVGPWKLDAAGQLRLSITNWTPAEIRAWRNGDRGALPAGLVDMEDEEQSVSVITISADGNNVAVGRAHVPRSRPSFKAGNLSIEVWPLRGSRGPYTFSKGLDALKGLAFSHDSQWLGAVSQAHDIAGKYTDILVGGVHLWHFADGTEAKLKIAGTPADVRQVPVMDEWSATNVAFSLDDKQLVADVFTPREPPAQDCPPGELCGDAESIPYEVRTTFFDVATGRAVNSTPLGESDSGEIEKRGFFWLSSDGKRAFARPTLVNTLTGRQVSTFKPPRLYPHPSGLDDCSAGIHAFGFAAFGPDTKQMAISDGEQLQILDAKTGTSASGDPIFAESKDPYYLEQWRYVAATFNRKGRTLATVLCSRFLPNGKVRLYDASNLQEAATTPADSLLTSLAFTPDDNLLFVGGRDGTLRAFEAQHGSLVATLFRNEGGDWIVFTPDGLYDASVKGASLLGWRLKGQIVLASELAGMHVPGLLAKLVAGERPKPATPLASAIADALAGNSQ